VAILVRFTPSGLTRDQYWSVSKKLEDGGHWPPPGLLAHVSFGPPGDLRVSEIWESREQQEHFAQSLMPILEQEGIGFAGDPEFLDVEAYELREARSDPPNR
jgi:hypothetical protein